MVDTIGTEFDCFHKTAVTPVLMHWSYHSLVLSHWYTSEFNQYLFLMDIITT